MSRTSASLLDFRNPALCSWPTTALSATFVRVDLTEAKSHFVDWGDLRWAPEGYLTLKAWEAFKSRKKCAGEVSEKAAVARMFESEVASLCSGTQSTAWHGSASHWSSAEVSLRQHGEGQPRLAWPLPCNLEVPYNYLGSAFGVLHSALDTSQPGIS